MKFGIRFYTANSNTYAEVVSIQSANVLFQISFEDLNFKC